MQVEEELVWPKESSKAVVFEKHQKDTIRAKIIIADSIKDHLIPQVASKKTLK
jgi:hypothetical protein